MRASQLAAGSFACICRSRAGAIREAGAKGLDFYFVLLDATSGESLGEAPLSLQPVLNAPGTPPKLNGEQLALGSR
jgi:hypothetical protein